LRGLALENESPAAKRTSTDLEQQAKSFPVASNKRSQVRESAQKEIFPVARNFK
jgi:hypothetical protein